MPITLLKYRLTIEAFDRKAQRGAPVVIRDIGGAKTAPFCFEADVDADTANLEWTAGFKGIGINSVSQSNAGLLPVILNADPGYFTRPMRVLFMARVPSGARLCVWNATGNNIRSRNYAGSLDLRALRRDIARASDCDERAIRDAELPPVAGIKVSRPDYDALADMKDVGHEGALLACAVQAVASKYESGPSPTYEDDMAPQPGFWTWLAGGRLR